jgi:hypothetical protein
VTKEELQEIQGAVKGAFLKSVQSPLYWTGGKAGAGVAPDLKALREELVYWLSKLPDPEPKPLENPPVCASEDVSAAEKPFYGSHDPEKASPWHPSPEMYEKVIRKHLPESAKVLVRSPRPGYVNGWISGISLDDVIKFKHSFDRRSCVPLGDLLTISATVDL